MCVWNWKQKRWGVQAPMRAVENWHDGSCLNRSSWLFSARVESLQALSSHSSSSKINVFLLVNTERLIPAKMGDGKFTTRRVWISHPHVYEGLASWTRVCGVAGASSWAKSLSVSLSLHLREVESIWLRVLKTSSEGAESHQSVMLLHPKKCLLGCWKVSKTVKNDFGVLICQMRFCGTCLAPGRVPFLSHSSSHSPSSALTFSHSHIRRFADSLSLVVSGGFDKRRRHRRNVKLRHPFVCGGLMISERDCNPSQYLPAWRQQSSLLGCRSCLDTEKFPMF